MGPITFNWFTQNARGTKLSVACQGTLYEPNRVKQREELRHLTTISTIFTGFLIIIRRNFLKNFYYVL